MAGKKQGDRLKAAHERLKRANRRIDENQKKYQELFDKSIDAIFVTTPELLFTDINKSMATLFGFDQNELLTLNLKNLFKDGRRFSELNKRITKNGSLIDFEAVLKTKSGLEINCVINMAELDVGDGSNFYIYQGIIHDVTARKRAEREMIMAEKIAMTGKIARSIAHEVRNPLTNLNLALEQLSDEIPESDDSTLYVDIIKRNADRIGQLITELLESSKPKSLELLSQPIYPVLDEALKLTKDRLKLREMKLKESFEKDLPDVRVDKAQLKTALLNIFINATEAMKTGVGVLLVEAKRTSDEIVIKISDNGKGIEKKNLTELFDPYFTAKKSGMGLGLTAVRNIINGHNGSIEVDSEIKKGTSFTIQLPIAPIS
ncbi:MAG: ATP-binding protein [Cyclobacteriaceae bacterium]